MEKQKNGVNNEGGEVRYMMKDDTHHMKQAYPAGKRSYAGCNQVKPFWKNKYSTPPKDEHCERNI